MASWDPTSYLSNAAMTQSVQRDMVASATQIINYYEYVTSHLESKKLTNEVVQKVEEQKGLLLEESICEESMVVPPEVVHISDAERRQVDDGTNAVWLKGVAMCVPFTIQCSTPHSTNEELVAWVQRQTTKTFGAMHSVFGHHADSEVSLLTDQETMVVSTDLCTVLAAALDLQVKTNGLFCVTAGSLRSVYDNAIDGTAVGDGVFVDPSTPESPLHESFQQALRALSSPVGLERTTRRVSKAKGVSLDFGGIAKGYICDVLLTALRSCDLCSFSGVMVEWGGDVATWGQPSSKRRWTMGIVKPPRLDSLYHSWKRGSTAGTASESPSTTTGVSSSDAVEYLHSVELTNGDLSCAATSGDYEQTRRFGFIHVVNPKDQRLLRAQSQTIASVTVLSGSAMMADALATALFASHVLDAAVPLAKSLTASSGLHRYYLYVRNFQQFVHNEEPHSGNSNDGPHEGHHSDETMTVDVRSMRVEARAAAVSRTNNADAFHHATTHPEQHDAEQQLAEDLKYLSGLTAHNEAIIVFNAEQNEGVHYAQLSSCEFIIDEGAVQYVVFNVMKGSALLNAVVASGSKFALHIVTSRDDQLWEELRHNRTTWMQMNGNRLVPLDRSVKTFEALRNETKVTIATTEVATVAGDHWVVVARLKDTALPWASIRRTTGAADGLHVAPCCIGGTHRMFGKVSCAGYGLRTCSLHPSMICCVVHSDMVSRMLSQLASPDVSLVLPLQSDDASRLLTSRVLQDSTIEVSASVVHQRQGAVPTWAAATVEGRLLDILHPTERTMVLLIVVRQVTLHQQPGSILSVPCF